MECGCNDDYCPYEGEPIEWMYTYWRSAKTKRKCCECKRDIPPGEIYEYVMAGWDGERHDTITCKECVTIANHYCCGNRIYGGDFLQGHIWECLGVDIITGDTRDE